MASLPDAKSTRTGYTGVQDLPVFLLLLSLAHGSVVTWYADGDGDGYGDPGVTLVAQDTAYPSGFVRNGTDSDDGDGATHPNASEICNANDNDCDGVVDDGACACKQEFYNDATYLFCTLPLDHASAVNECAMSGYHLTAIADAAENTWLWSTIIAGGGGWWWSCSPACGRRSSR